jgi:hypothetical protein
MTRCGPSLERSSDAFRGHDDEDRSLQKRGPQGKFHGTATFLAAFPDMTAPEAYRKNAIAGIRMAGEAHDASQRAAMLGIAHT